MSVGTMLDAIPDSDDIIKAQAIIDRYNLRNLDKNMALRYAVPKYKDFFYLVHFMNAQMKAKEIELLLIESLHGIPVSAAQNLGDGFIDNKYYELKTSTTNLGNNLNIRQIRPWQNIDYYLCSYINEFHLEKSRFFLLTKTQMNNEIELIGGYTHGTKKANADNVHTEYSMTIAMYGDNETTQRWNNKYWYHDMYDIICNR